MSNNTSTSTLIAPFADGTAGQAQLFHLVEKGHDGTPLATSLPLTATSDNPAVAVGVVNGLDVDVQAVGAGTCTITVTDGRAGVQPVTIAVTCTAQDDQSSLEIASADAPRAK